ncbi:hypothetical protein Gotur_004465 [Gossypium turneri]
MGEAVTQVREVADHLKTLAVWVDVLSLKYESESSRGRELAWLFRRVKDLRKSPVVDSGVDHEDPIYPPGANAIIKSGGKRIKADIAEVKTPLSWIWKRMINGGLIKQESKERFEGVGRYCEFHAKEGYDIQNCTGFRAMVQNLMNNKELEFYEEIKGLKEGEVYASEERSKGKAQKVNHQVVIISRPRSTEAGIQIAPRVIIQKPVSFPYNDSKRVH